MNDQFALDKDNGKLMGVCAGFARWAEFDPTLTRAGMVLATLMLGPVAILLYLVTGFAAGSR